MGGAASDPLKERKKDVRKAAPQVSPEKAQKGDVISAVSACEDEPATGAASDLLEEGNRNVRKTAPQASPEEAQKDDAGSAMNPEEGSQSLRSFRRQLRAGVAEKASLYEVPEKDG